ncbi:hypothetical protein RB195_001706 [Necator americanus]|uniref:Uncharacterized protein n=1 Tax=Necator americanus TaxID=51031 RepID=A0ABR1DFJ5_NECAM
MCAFQPRSLCGRLATPAFLRGEVALSVLTPKWHNETKSSRLVSTPVENSASSSSEEVVKGVKHASSQEQVQRQAELSETTVQSVLQRAFRGLVRRQESELIRRNVQTIPPASVSQTPKSEPMVYVEKDGFLSGLTVAEAVFAFNFADEKDANLTPDLLLHWRICSAVRAVCASAAWLLLALRPNCDVLGETIKKTALSEMVQRNNDLLEEIPEDFRSELAKMLDVQQ